MNIKTLSNKKDPFDFGLLFKIYALALPYKKQLINASIFSLIIAVLGPLRPLLIQYTLDNEVYAGDSAGLGTMILLLCGMLLLQTVFQFYLSYLTNFLGQTVIRDLRSKVYDHLTSLRLKFFDKTPVGTLITRNISDIETIADIFSEGLITISGDLITLVFVVIIMFSVDWQLSLVCLSVLPLLFYSSYVFKEKIKVSFQDVRTQVARLNTFVQEHIQGMQVVQIFNRQKRELDKFREINKGHRDANVRSVFYYAVFFPVVEIITAISTGLLVWWWAKGVMAERITPGVLVSFTLFINMFFRPIRQLADKFNSLQMGMVAADRIFKLLDNKDETEKTGILIPDKITGKVEFKNVVFSYIPSQPVLKNFSLLVPSGNTTAVVGHTGAGKTSVINLLNRFYEINEGKILIDDIEINQFHLPSLRKNISVVLQDVFLFSGSIMENIRMFDKNVPEEKVIEASRMIGAARFIEKLPFKYDTPVFERGGSLSVGQRQLISLIRAMVFDPKILVLDEATSSIDNETEELIQEATRILMKDRTSIVIAHRLSTIRNANEIIVMDHGEIRERGTHDQLIEKNGAYKRLYELQFAV